MLDEPELPVQQKLDLLMRFLERLTEHPGQRIEFDNVHDYSIACAKNLGEIMFYFDGLADRKLIERHAPFTGSSKPRATITVAGWNELKRLENLGDQSSSVFIAMAFSPTRDQFERAISEAIKEAGYVPVRVDQVEHINKIDDEIIARIRAAKFLVADFTMQRNGVYFEAGFMLGLGRPVIWLCDKAELSLVHFDTRQYNMIDYEGAEDLRRRLQLRIQAVLGKGPVTVLAQ